MSGNEPAGRGGGGVPAPAPMQHGSYAPWGGGTPIAQQQQQQAQQQAQQLALQHPQQQQPYQPQLQPYHTHPQVYHHQHAAAAPTAAPVVSGYHHRQPHPHHGVQGHGQGPAIVVHEHDVLSGRGVNISQHPGNERFRALVNSRYDGDYCETYSTSEKRAVAEQILSHIKTSLDPPGRFLQRPGRGRNSRGLEGPWDELTQAAAIKKTVQALRDCNRQDRSGYAAAVTLPDDVREDLERRSQSGLTNRQIAQRAAEAANRQLALTQPHFGTIVVGPMAAAAAAAAAAVTAAANAVTVVKRPRAEEIAPAAASTTAAVATSSGAISPSVENAAAWLTVKKPRIDVGADAVVPDVTPMPSSTTPATAATSGGTTTTHHHHQYHPQDASAFPFDTASYPNSPHGGGGNQSTAPFGMGSNVGVDTPPSPSAFQYSPNLDTDPDVSGSGGGSGGGTSGRPLLAPAPLVPQLQQGDLLEPLHIAAAAAAALEQQRGGHHQLQLQQQQQHHESSSQQLHHQQQQQQLHLQQQQHFHPYHHHHPHSTEDQQHLNHHHQNHHDEGYPPTLNPFDDLAPEEHHEQEQEQEQDQHPEDDHHHDPLPHHHNPFGDDNDVNEDQLHQD